jgi:hypothetical protein
MKYLLPWWKKGKEKRNQRQTGLIVTVADCPISCDEASEPSSKLFLNYPHFLF